LILLPVKTFIEIFAETKDRIYMNSLKMNVFKLQMKFKSNILQHLL